MKNAVDIAELIEALRALPKPISVKVEIIREGTIKDINELIEISFSSLFLESLPLACFSSANAQGISVIKKIFNAINPEADRGENLKIILIVLKKPLRTPVSNILL